MLFGVGTREGEFYVDRSTSITAALHIRGDGDPHPDHGMDLRSFALQPISFPTSTFPSSASSGIITGSSLRTWPTASSALPSARSPPPSTTSNISNRSRSMELLSLRCSCSQLRTFNEALRRLQRFLRRSSGNCLPEPRRPSFLLIAHRACRSCSWLSRGKTFRSKQLNDYGLNFIRTQLITVPGASVPYPYGGKQRQVQVDLNTTALQSKGLSALDVVNAISLQNLILPTGTSKIGRKEYDVSIPNAAPQTIADLNRIPIKTIGGTTIYMKDVAWVRDGFPPQTNIVRVNGQRSVLLTIQKAGDASTLERDLRHQGSSASDRDHSSSRS